MSPFSFDYVNDCVSLELTQSANANNTCHKLSPLQSAVSFVVLVNVLNDDHSALRIPSVWNAILTAVETVLFAASQPLVVNGVRILYQPHDLGIDIFCNVRIAPGKLCQLSSGFLFELQPIAQISTPRSLSSCHTTSAGTVGSVPASSNALAFSGVGSQSL